MKEINGTITLAYVEEDNKQRVIFRVIPLCTREGCVFQGGAEDFPDEGCMRIVPDKREQSTFKERMREIGGLCAIQLTQEGKELLKVRQNRNYAPDQGERNQLAIYSDVVCEFAPGGCYEVVEAGADAANALTDSVLLHKDKVLYGPVDRQGAAQADVGMLKPFGNDRFLLHSVHNPLLGEHRIYWDPEATITWRQKRGSLRRRERSVEEDAAPKPEAMAETTPQEAKAEEPPRRERRAERAASKPEPPAAPEGDMPLPIGERLEILDSDLSFENQLTRLAQPLSETANRLSELTILQDTDEPAMTARFSGTPLMKPGGKILRIKTRPDNMHHVVEQQIRRKRDAVMGAEMGEAAGGLVENPIESLRDCLEYVWQNVDMRRQALDMLLENEAFVSDVSMALRRGGMNLQAYAAAQEQLAEIEADRISLLMQLEQARENEKKYREDAVARLSQKRREEAERLKREIAQLTQTRDKLAQAAQVLSNGTAAQVTDFLAAQMSCLSAAGEQRVLLSPVLGKTYSQKELGEKLRVHINNSGFHLSEDDATSLLIHFALYDGLCLRARTQSDALRFANVMLESLGLQSVSATVMPGAYVEMISLLPEDSRRTPTVTVQPVGTETMSVYGHKTIYLANAEDVMSGALSPCPVIHVPPMARSAFATDEAWEPLEPASLQSFLDIRADKHPMLDEAEKWFTGLTGVLSQADLSLPDGVTANMRRFIEVASRKVRGGFLAAADAAVCHWVVPMLQWGKADIAAIAEAVAGLPHTMNLLGIR